VENRPSCSENVRELHDINDIRNGVFANTLIHSGFNPRRLAILVVCHNLSNYFCLHLTTKCSDAKPYAQHHRYPSSPRSNDYARKRQLSDPEPFYAPIAANPGIIHTIRGPKQQRCCVQEIYSEAEAVGAVAALQLWGRSR
jgi:hypothetical protein